MRFLDTNVFIRVISADDATKHQACMRLFEDLEQGRDEATTTESVIAEVVYVLTSSRWYGMTRDDAASQLLPLLRVPDLRLAQKARYLTALELFITHRSLDFEDALLVAHDDRATDQIVSYDRDFDRVPDVARVEP